MATRVKAKRVVRSYKHTKDFSSGETLISYYSPEIKYEFDDCGLDNTIEVSKCDLEKLNYPDRIKVVIYNLDD